MAPIGYLGPRGKLIRDINLKLKILYQAPFKARNLDILYHCLIFLFQSMLKSIGGSQMEQDYKLVENEGLFQEYLEMGKPVPSQKPTL
jgi:hypothetical protein